MVGHIQACWRIVVVAGKCLCYGQLQMELVLSGDSQKIGRDLEDV